MGTMGDEARNLAEARARAADAKDRELEARRSQWEPMLADKLAAEFAQEARRHKLPLDHKTLFGGWWRVSIPIFSPQTSSTTSGLGDDYDIYIRRNGSYTIGVDEVSSTREQVRAALVRDLARRMPKWR